MKFGTQTLPLNGPKHESIHCLPVTAVVTSDFIKVLKKLLFKMKLNRIPAVKDNLLQVDVILVASTAKSAVSIKEKLAQNHDKFDFPSI